MPNAKKLLLSSLLLLTAPLLTTASAQDHPAEVRVRLFEEAAPRAIVVSAERGLRFVAGEGPDNALAELAPGEEAAITTRDDEVYVKMNDFAFFARSLRVIPQDDALFTVEVAGQKAPEPRRYPGRLALRVDGKGPELQLVNHVALDDYVACVVGREFGFDDLESAKAMAVLARTYTLRNAGKYGDAYDHVDHRLSQQYDGADRMTPTAREATRLTHGEVLTYRGDLVEAVYFSSSGGHTADNDAVWESGPVPYLRGVPDPYDTASPHARWRTTISRDDLLKVLSRTYGFPVDGFVLGDRSRDGRVWAVELLEGGRPRRVVRSNAFRMLLSRHFGMKGLKSTLFDARREGDVYVFEGRGFGHGVGLSQYGALEMSRRGHAYREILGYYFTDVALQQLGGGPAEPLVSEAPASQGPAAKKSARRAGW